MEKIRLYILFILFYLVFGIWHLAFVYAEGIDIGAFKLYPTIKVEERFENNVYLLANNAESDLITTITPELFFESKTEEGNMMSLDYKYEMLYFSGLKEKNRRTNDIEAKVGLVGLVYFLKVEGNFKEVAAPSSYAAGFIDYNLSAATVNFGRDYKKFSYELTFEDLDYDYTEIDSPTSRNEPSINIACYYKLLPKTSGLVEYTFGQINYKNAEDNDAIYNEFLTGVKGELSPRISGAVKAGYKERDNKTKEDRHQIVTYTDISYSLSKKTTFSLSYTRSTEEASYKTEDYKDKDRVELGVAQELTGKTTISAASTHEQHKYPATASSSGPRKDNLWNLRFALDTKTRRWLNLGASYEFRQRDSNVASNDYENNITSVYLKAMY